MLETISIKGKDYTVTKTVETDGGDNDHEVITATNGDIVYRFSPNTTDDELLAEADRLSQA